MRTLTQNTPYASDVKRLQQALAELGYPMGQVDGAFDPRTKRAVMDLQAERGLSPTGIVDDGTWAALQPPPTPEPPPPPVASPPPVDPAVAAALAQQAAMPQPPAVEAPPPPMPPQHPQDALLAEIDAILQRLAGGPLTGAPPAPEAPAGSAEDPVATALMQRPASPAPGLFRG